MKRKIYIIMTSRSGRPIIIRIAGDKRDIDILEEQTDLEENLNQMIMAPTHEEMRQWYREKFQSGEWDGTEYSDGEAEKMANKAIEEGPAALIDNIPF